MVAGLFLGVMRWRCLSQSLGLCSTPGMRRQALVCLLQQSAVLQLAKASLAVSVQSDLTEAVEVL